ncbi:MAG: MATE family efflux transporter [Firmicutes bacterium]|jgi:putative MATE family efflux protein|nr:MATE family efflux transporter [Bacillota bacterium]MDD4337111.1 MATE family efflux transporter [Bacillota bacterium]MDD4793312.1 MATE family efflux transporter [Bacillota bacterium]
MQDKMKPRSGRDFTTGSIPRHLVAFATPMLIGNFLQATYSTVDSIWVGRFIGPQALAAVSVNGPVVFSLIAMVSGLTMATTTVVSQYWGARQYDRASEAIANSVTLLSLLGLALAAIGYNLRWPLLRLIGAPHDIIDDAAAYLGVYTIGFLPMLVYNVTSSILRGLGDSVSPMKFLGYATVLNIVLDPLMIFGLGPIPAMGVVGTAWATVISQAFSAVLALRHVVKRSGLVSELRQLVRFDWELTSLTVKIGLPAGAQQTLVSLGQMVIMSTVNKFGSIVVAGSAAGGRIEQYAFMPAMSLGLAVTALTGQNLGAGRSDRVSQIVKWSVLISCSTSAVLTIIAQAIPGALISIFNNNPEVIAEGVMYLRWISLGFVPFSAMFALNGVLRGAGDTLPSFFMTLASLWLVRIPLVTVLSRTSLGVRGVWMGTVTGPFVSMVLGYVYYRSGRWKGRAVVSRPDVEEDSPGLHAGGEDDALDETEHLALTLLNVEGSGGACDEETSCKSGSDGEVC